MDNSQRQTHQVSQILLDKELITTAEIHQDILSTSCAAHHTNLNFPSTVNDRSNSCVSLADPTMEYYPETTQNPPGFHPPLAFRKKALHRNDLEIQTSSDTMIDLQETAIQHQNIQALLPNGSCDLMTRSPYS